MKGKIYIFLVLLLIPVLFFGQVSMRDNNWYFGNNAGVSFNTGSPVAVAGSAMSTSEGCASISNTGGQLLFYTDGATVWDKTHIAMPNADGSSWNKKLSGNSSSAQSAIITTHPCDTNKYYVFTTDGETSFDATDPKGMYDGLYYTVIDMTLNGGKGDVDLAYLAAQPGYVAGGNKIELIDSIQEKVNAAIHSNGVNYWVVAQRINGDFYAYKIDCNGIDMTPRKSLNLYGPGAHVTYANMAFSKDGKSLTVAGGFNWSVHLFDFNNTTGIASNKRTLVADVMELGAAWGVCYSPNDSIIYVVPWGGVTYKRFKRFAPNVPASGVIATLPTSTTVIQLAPNGKMYATNNDATNYLSVFNTPNNFANPGFVSNAVALGAGTCSYGLPNMFSGFSSMRDPEFVRNDTSFCTMGQASLSLGKAAMDCFTYSWDPPLGLDDPTSSNPVATLNQTTTFKVTASTVCKTSEDSVTITVSTCEESAVFFPNAFTPNNDGVNDIFIPSLYDYVDTQYELLIFDRWGNLIFKTNNPKQGWNGNVKTNRPAQQDVYVYKILAFDKYGIELSKIGHFSLVR